MENANKELRLKIKRFQQERDTLHSLIRKHLPKCISRPEIETSNMETDASNKTAVEKVVVESRRQAAEVPNKTTAATWTVTNPTETVNVADAMDRKNVGEMSGSSQIPQVKSEPTEERKIHPDVKGPAVVTTAGHVIWPGMVQAAQPGVNITTHGVTADLRNAQWPELTTMYVPPVVHLDHPVSQPHVPQYSADLNIPNLDQPLVIDLSPDRFNRTPRTESTSAETTQQNTIKIIGHYVIR